MSGDAAAVVGAAKWGSEGRPIGEWALRAALPLPARVVKGQWGGLGAPTLPAPNLQQTLLVANAGKLLSVVAQGVKFKDSGRRTVPVGPKISIPDTFDGWFEILSEDGRASRCIEGGEELARRRPTQALVRESVRVHVQRPADEPEGPADRTRTLQAGEVLNIGDVVSGQKSSRSGSGRYLSCSTTSGDSVYLPLESRGRFSPVAGEDGISGVHRVRTLLANKRLPLMVRLVQGKAPPRCPIEMRLYAVAEEDSLVALPLSKEGASLVALPHNAPLKVLAPKNPNTLIAMPEFQILIDRCRSLMPEVCGAIQLCNREIKKSNQEAYNRKNSCKVPPLVRRSVSDPQGTNTTNRSLERGLSDVSLNLEEDTRYDEIDQIYDYVRGFAPLPSNIKTEATDKLPLIAHKFSDEVPEPPSIETIPGLCKQVTVSIVNRTPTLETKEIFRRNKNDNHIYEKVDRPLLLRSNSASKVSPNKSKRVVDHNNNNNSRGPFSKRHSAHGAASNRRFLKNVDNSKRGKTCWLHSGVKTSPIFHIRYKSLTDLLMDSSHNKKSSPEGSSSRNSEKKKEADSSSSSKGEEEERRCLSRSLTNLFTPKNHNYYSVIQNDLIKPLNCPKFCSMPDTNHSKNAKKLGTLYL